MFRRRAIGDHSTAAEFGPDAVDMQAAYERGRKDERASRRRHPLFMTVLFAAAAGGLAIISVAAWEGSFGRGGQVVDRNLSAAADRAEPAVRAAASDAGQTLRNAGQATSDGVRQPSR
jgi:hypothetical protein